MCMYTYICTHTHIYIYIYLCCIYTYICIYVYIYTHLHVNMHIIYVFISIKIYMHTHLHLCVCVWNPVLFAEEPRSREIPIVISITNAQIMAAKNYCLLQRYQGSLEKLWIPALGQGKHELSLECLILPESKEVLKE